MNPELITILTAGAQDIMGKQLTQIKIKDYFYYSYKSGEFTRIKYINNQVNIGDIAGCECLFKNGKKYRTIKIEGVRYYAHRLVWLYVTGSFPKDQIDHIDGNGLNNKWENLRESTNTENARNQRLRSNNKSGYLGVSWCKTKRKWVAYIREYGKQINLGSFYNKNNAIEARTCAENKYGYDKNHGQIRPL